MIKISHAAAESQSYRILLVEQLSERIGKTTNTIRTCATNKKYQHLIPRPFKLPGSRRLCWWEHEVLAWMQSNRPAEPPPTKRPRGRPTKLEQLSRARWQELNASIPHRTRTVEPAEPHPSIRPQELPIKAEQPRHARWQGQNATVQHRAGGKK